MSGADEAVRSAGHDARGEPHDPTFEDVAPRAGLEFIAEEALPVCDPVGVAERSTPGVSTNSFHSWRPYVQSLAIAGYPTFDFFAAPQGGKRFGRHRTVVRESILSEFWPALLEHLERLVYDVHRPDGTRSTLSGGGRPSALVSPPPMAHTPLAMRRLVICCDGTWNDPAANTNVYQLKNRIARRDQPLYYDAGVGTERVRNEYQSWLSNTLDRISDKVLGGMFGSGISGNTQEAYRWVCENYEEGDELWFFGYSRGAFTVRTTVGLIRKLGLLRPPIDPGILQEAYDLYRKPDPHPDTGPAEQFRVRQNTLRVDELDIRFLGVWDTVGALGVPGLHRFMARRRWGFHDYRLSSHVKNACQAIATDELRAPFLAALWEAPTDPGQSVEQVWFAGSHSDIGGGEQSLRWMAEKAASAGLDFEPPVSEWPAPGRPPQRPAELEKFYFRVYGGRLARPMGHAMHANQSLHPSLEALYDSDEDYRPVNLVAYKLGTPLEAPAGRRWWYTLFHRYYLNQYRDRTRK